MRMRLLSSLVLGEENDLIFIFNCMGIFFSSVRDRIANGLDSPGWEYGDWGESNWVGLRSIDWIEIEFANVYVLSFFRSADMRRNSMVFRMFSSFRYVSVISIPSCTRSPPQKHISTRRRRRRYRHLEDNGYTHRHSTLIPPFRNWNCNVNSHPSILPTFCNKPKAIWTTDNFPTSYSATSTTPSLTISSLPSAS